MRYNPGVALVARRQAQLGAVLAVMALFTVPAPGTVSAVASETVTAELHPGWNLVGWTGDAADVDVVFSEIPQLVLAYTWDAQEQRYRSALRDGPMLLGDLREVRPGLGLWLYVGGSEPISWERPLVPGSLETFVHRGWNVVGWAGPSGVKAEYALADLSGVLLEAWSWNAGAQRFQNILENTAHRLSRGDAIALRVSMATPWDQVDTQLRFEFVGDFTQDRRTDIEAVVHNVAAFFDHRYEVRVPGLMVRVGDSASDVPCGGYGWKTIFLQEACISAAGHEYSHAAQEYLATVEPDHNWGRANIHIGAAWLSEGVANYAAAVFNAQSGFQSLDVHVENSRIAGITNQKKLETLETDMFLGDAGANYRLASLAAYHLIELAGEQALYDFYRIRPLADSWEEAFFRAFGLPVDDFYREFEKYRHVLASRHPQVEGRVVGPDGVGQLGVRVEVTPEGTGEALQTTTDEEGLFSTVVLEGAYRLSLFLGDTPCHLGWYGGEGHTTSRLAITVLDLPKDAETDILVMLPKAASDMCRAISGTVVDPSGTPIAGLWVSAFGRHDRDGYSADTSTVEGRFDILVRGDGDYEISLHSAVAVDCTVLGYRGGRPAVAVADEDVSGVLIVVVTGPRHSPLWVDCGPEPDER